MGIATKRVKKLVRAPDVNRCAYGSNRWIAYSRADPEIAVIWCYDSGMPIVVTVIYRRSFTR